MSIPVDELIANLANSMKSNHIGQEATDLATLQTELSETLQQYNRASYQTAQGQPPNTPTQTSGSWNFSSFADPNQRSRTRRVQRSRAQSLSQPTPAPDETDEMMMIDEEEVEALLLMHSPHQTQPVQSFERPQSQQFYSQHTPAYNTAESPMSPNSNFASSDPFYASLKARPFHQTSHPASIIAPQTAFLGHSHPQAVHANQ